MTNRITIDVHRDDGDVVRLEGVAGVAMVMQSDIAPAANLQEMPVVSIRENNEAQLALMLATLMAVCRTKNPAIIDQAICWEQLVDPGNPISSRTLD